MQTIPRRSLVFLGRQSNGVLQERHVMPILRAPDRPVNSLSSRFRVIRRLRAAFAQAAARLLGGSAR